MLSVRRRSRVVAAASIFAAIYSVLGLIPVSPYVGISSFLTFREILSPLAGMLFGPVSGGFSMVLGSFIDFGLGRPVSFDFLDFVPDLVSAVTAGLCFTGRRKAAVALPVALMVVYSVDPLSSPLIAVGGVAVPFVWMHALSALVLSLALVLERNGKLTRLSPAFITATVFASTMAGHVAGSVLYENVLVRVNHILSAQAIHGSWPIIFYLYPPERLLFTLLGTLVSVPVLRSLTRTGRTSATSS